MMKQLAGYWIRPSKPEFEEFVSLFPNGHLEFKVTPKTSKAALMNVVIGETRNGTWGLTARRPPQFLDKIRSSSAATSERLPNSSMSVVPKFLRDFARYDPETGECRDRRRTAGTVHQAQIGWLILKTTKLVDSRLNPNIAGTHLHLADWFNDLSQIFGDNLHAVIEFEEPKLTLRLSDGRVEKWERITKFLPEAGDQ